MEGKSISSQRAIYHKIQELSRDTDASDWDDKDGLIIITIK